MLKHKKIIHVESFTMFSLLPMFSAIPIIREYAKLKHLIAIVQIYLIMFLYIYTSIQPK